MSHTLNAEAQWTSRHRIINRASKATGLSAKEITRFLKFAIVGAIGMIVDLAVLTFTREVFGVPLSVAVGLGFMVAVFSNFTWNRLWTFPESRSRPVATQLGQFAFVNLIGLGLNELIVLGLHPFFSEFLQDPPAYLAAKVIAVGVVLFWNYGANRVWTYRGIQ